MHQIHLRGKKGSSEMPMCDFGHACNRKDCVYRHPPKQVGAEDKSSSVCIAHLQGVCTFGPHCRNVHVGDEEAEKLWERFASTMCRYGSRCATKNCLYYHPPPDPCPYGARCPNPYCQNSHPETEEVSETPVVMPSSTPPLVFPKSKALLAKEKQQSSERSIVSKRHPTIKVPPEYWVSEYERNAGVYYDYADPVERLLAVNERSPESVIDLHYQTAHLVGHVLDLALNSKPGDVLHFWKQKDRERDGVWVVTGAGLHTTQKGRKLLFESVLEHLEQQGYEFKIALNADGAPGGFLIKL